MKEFPTLYHQARTGKLHSWRIWADGSEVYTEHGTVDGLKQVSKYTAVPTNVGRSNERNGEEQAIFEAEAKWKFQIDRKYSDTPEKAHEIVFLPMLANKLEDKKHYLFNGDKKCSPANFVACDIQPKLDGVRCMAYNDDGTIVLLSRQGKVWEHVPHINEQLSWLPIGDCLDGELYVHGENFQSITSWSKGKNKMPHPESTKICYHIYDYPVVGDNVDWGSWDERRIKLQSIPVSRNIIVTDTYGCDSFEDIQTYHIKFCNNGYEGAIIRIRKGRYQLGFRSSDLLKVKSFLDEEYEVIGAVDGKGKEESKAIWVCRDNRGNVFNVRSQGAMEERADMFKHKESYFGKMLKVKFFEKTNDGLPRFPIGIGFRDEKDM